MENKILIEIYVPIVEKRYDLFVPINKKLGAVRDLMIKNINEEAGFEYLKKDFYTIYNEENGIPYSLDEIILHQNIRNGHRLIMI